MIRHRRIPMTVFVPFLFLLLFLPLSSCLSQREQRLVDFRSAPLFGMVYDYDQKPVPGALILVDGEEGPRSDINGRFVLRSLERGEHGITVLKEGYEELAVEVEFLSRTQALYLKVISLNQLLREVERALEVRELGQAAALLERAAAVDPDDPVLLFLRGVYLLKRGEPRAAAEVLEEVLSLGYRQATVYLSLADIYEFELQDRVAAARYLQEYLRIERDPEAERRLQSLLGP
jgi:tetratricopeptide (TPR) repeat protein